MSNNEQCSCGSGLIPNWEYDGNHIPLCKVCDECRDERLSKYRPEIISSQYSQEQVLEPIESEDY